MQIKHFEYPISNPILKRICKKINIGERINKEEALYLYQNAELGLIGAIANNIREKRYKNSTFFIKNFHIEPSNICVYNCKFCSFSKKKDDGGWTLSSKEIINKIKPFSKDINELHIVGSAHPDRDIYFYGNLLKEINTNFPLITLKAFSAIEIGHMTEKAGISIENGLKYLKECGLEFIPGGGAEIFNEDIRFQICNDKFSANDWISIHRTAHKMGISSNATMLYGHIEKINHRIDHLEILRNLQDETNMFSAFIPLKFKNKNNELSNIKESILNEDLKMFAISRIFLDNFPHIKAYWPMLGKSATQLSLGFGVNDIDGTINNSTSIYSMAGSEDIEPVMTVEEMNELIIKAGREPIERDAFYNSIN